MVWTVQFNVYISADNFQLSLFKTWLESNYTEVQQTISPSYRFDTFDEFRHATYKDGLLQVTLTYAAHHTAQYLINALKQYLGTQLKCVFVIMQGDYEARRYMGSKLDLICTSSVDTTTPCSS